MSLWIVAMIFLAVAAAAAMLGAGGVDSDLYKYCVYNGKMFDENKQEWVPADQWEPKK